MSDDLAKQLRTDAEAYRQSLAAPTSHDMFTLAYQWQDKKHRHVWDLCDRLETAADRIEKLEAQLARSQLKGWAACWEEQADRIKELEAALRSIAANACCDSCREAALVAQKALEGKDD